MKVRKLASRLMISILLFLCCVACKKEITTTTGSLNANVGDREMLQELAILKEVARALEDVYANGRAVAEVYAAVSSKYYADERVLLRDLLFPENSEVYKSKIFKENKIDTGIFRREFLRVVLNGSYPKLQSELFSHRSQRNGSATNVSAAVIQSGIGVLSATQPVSIYFPYSENFLYSPITDPRLSVPRKPTIIAADRDADSGPGRAPFFCHNNPEFTCYRSVVVDDEYAYGRPTHIVAVGADVSQGVLLTPPNNAAVSRVYHGASKLTRQMDRLISFLGNGGGSEIKVCRVNGYLRRQDEQIDDFAGDVVTLQYTRGDIRNRRWKRVYSVWDPNWNYQDVEQIYAVYEEDTKGSKTVDGTLRTTLSVPGKAAKVEGDIGFKIQVSTQDEIITQRKIDRKSYFYDALNDQGWGFLADPADFLVGRDWPVYDGGSIWQYTFPYRIY